MKRRIMLLAVFWLCVPVWSQSIPLGEIVGDDRTIRDPLYGFSARYPSGWEVRGITRWGDKETTIYFGAPTLPHAFPTLYYRIYSSSTPAAGAAEAYLRDEAQKKAEQRVSGGLADYGNLANSFSFKTIAGRPALSYTASYSAGGRTYGEYFVRILSDKGVAVFFLRAPLEELDELRPAFDGMVGSVRLP